MDARMPDGIDVARALRAQDDGIQIVGLGAHDDLIPMCVEAGIGDFLPSEASPADIRRAVAGAPDDRCGNGEGSDLIAPADGSSCTRPMLGVLILLRSVPSNK